MILNNLGMIIKIVAHICMILQILILFATKGKDTKVLVSVVISLICYIIIMSLPI